MELHARIDVKEAPEEAIQVLKGIRKKVQKSVRKDRAVYYEQLADQVEKASVLGKQKEVFKVVDRIKGGKAGAADLTGVNLDRWMGHFKALLGEAKAKAVPDVIKKKLAWVKAEQRLQDKKSYAKPWNVDSGPPSLAEFKKALKSCKNQKGVNKDQIPAELWKNSYQATVLLWKLVRKVWKEIQAADGGSVRIPEDWLSATLVCLYKNKGSRKDPAMYRGISLISTVEKILSIILLNRITKYVDRRLLQGQNGFRALKACRDAVFQLWREIERGNRSLEPYIFTFIDYSKAFDSLLWNNLWGTVEYAGCPSGLTTVMKALYEQSTIAIRLSSDGTLAPDFAQKKGIRQGSSLSPCLFVIALDFCLRVFEESCTELGLPPRDGSWFGYADDIADKSSGEVEATEALQQLEAASAFVGLRLNIKKCESMGKRITKQVKLSSFIADKTKELVEVQFEDGWFRGWKTEASCASLIGIKRPSKIPDVNIAILFHDGDAIYGNERGGGWMRDEDDDAHRIRKLGMKTALVVKDSKGHRCATCGSTFDTEIGLRTHHTKKLCRLAKDMDSKELRRLHRTRQTSSTRRGKTAVPVEQIRVLTCEGKATKPCGDFVYLGTLTNPTASATPEIRRRIGIALGTFGSIGKIWKSKSISRKTKSRLYVAIILSIMLYNAEIWTVKKQDIRALESAHFRMIRSMMNLGEDDAHLNRLDALEAFKLPLIEDYISQKRMRWVGHALRRCDDDRSKIAVLETLGIAESPWTKLVRNDCSKLKIPFQNLPKLVMDRTRFRQMSHWHMFNSLG